MNYPTLLISAMFLGIAIFYMRNDQPKSTELEALKLEVSDIHQNRWLGFGFVCLSVVMFIASAHFA